MDASPQEEERMEEETALGDVAATSLITLSCHAIETQSVNPILSNPRSVEISAMPDPVLSRFESPLERMLAKGTPNPGLVVHIAIRAKNTMNMSQIS